MVLSPQEEQIIMKALSNIVGYPPPHDNAEGLSAFVQCHLIALTAMNKVMDSRKSRTAMSNRLAPFTNLSFKLKD